MKFLLKLSRINVKAVLAALGATFAITGGALYGTNNQQPTTLTEPEDEMDLVPPKREVVEINKLISDNQKFVGEINVRDAMIDNKNKQIEELEKENKAGEEYAEDLEGELDNKNGN